MFRKKSKVDKQNKKRLLITHEYPKSTISEQYRMIRSNIDFSTVDKTIRTIVVTSAAPSAGKSTSAANIAITYAQADKKVLLIDGDLRKPTVHYTFETNNVIGLSSLITKQAEYIQAIKKTEIENLDIITSGPIPPNPSELLGSNNMEQIIKELLVNYDVIIIDTPPVLAVTDAAILSQITDGTILVTNVANNNRNHLIKTKDILVKANANILGIILNNVKNSDKDDYYYYNYYGEKNNE
ncbi:CpsD/CapB family tyrosine-protein kinase [Macrococcus capreoli]|uniref:CpsD/CapB family tyrosine-protein kinase n=1 Tax=Macrococcus capreoli TaxID=2982690 RepID=UPI0021D60E28|nr:CpsD/CapB family tyrosine-protein kinase [Macrococcus sp. TMW 2.2395]MCU7557537.1 CpsD/CapB family tyrosine-protein kinase [Macrococcus sp. TMW 2.2395]